MATFRSWVKEQAKTKYLFLVRILLCFSLAYYLPGVFVLPSLERTGKKTAETVSPDGAEAGMGGGLVLEYLTGMEMPDDIFDLEVEGMPEPAEYSRPRMLTYSTYTVVRGDTISDIALWSGLNEDTILSINKITNSRLLQINQVLKIPNQDGIYYTISHNDTLASIGEKYEVEPETIITVNEFFTESIPAGTPVFVPGAKMDWTVRQEINGDLFIWPVRSYVTSNYGWRQNPFGGGLQFHTGIDIGAPTGTPIRAAMGGRVSTAAYDSVFGNYVVITHHSGYRTLYGHMSVVRVRTGAYVNTYDRIGDVGSTGLSTGPHLHFTVYKNGVTVNPRTLLH